MADQDENEHNSGEPPVISSLDIESMQVRLLIICNNERLLENVAVFLNRRGWETKVTANLKEAMASVTTLKPDFVLISANHQNTRLMRLPLALKQTLQIPTIGFCETGDARTLGILQQLPVDHRLMGHVSGPNVQRRIRQILQQMHNPDTASTERRMASLGDNASDLVAIKGGGEREDRF